TRETTRRAMGRSVVRAFLATALLCSWVAGCNTTPTMTKQPKPPPPDPLLMSKKPIEGKPFQPDFDQVTRFDPTPPPWPQLPPFPPGPQFAAPGIQRDPVSGVQLGFEPATPDNVFRPTGRVNGSDRP